MFVCLCLFHIRNRHTQLNSMIDTTADSPISVVKQRKIQPMKIKPEHPGPRALPPPSLHLDSDQMGLALTYLMDISRSLATIAKSVSSSPSSSKRTKQNKEKVRAAISHILEGEHTDTEVEEVDNDGEEKEEEKKSRAPKSLSDELKAHTTKQAKEKANPKHQASRSNSSKRKTSN